MKNSETTNNNDLFNSLVEVSQFKEWFNNSKRTDITKFFFDNKMYLSGIKISITFLSLGLLFASSSESLLNKYIVKIYRNSIK